MSQKLQKWDRWVDSIRLQLHEVMGSRHVFRETFALIKANPQLPRTSRFYHALRVWYGDHALMAVRRQIKNDPQSISLLRLLIDIRDNASLINRDHWIRVVGNGPGDSHAHRAFDRVAGPGALTLPPDRVDRDIQRLSRNAASCERYVDKRVAHHDRRKPPVSPTYDDLDKALDTIDELLRKYYNLVTGNSLLSTTPLIAYNWKKVFRHGWLSE